MEHIYPALLWLHVCAGTVALLTYWLAAAMKKGSQRHRRVGRVYLVSMLAICATALPMALTFLLRGRAGTATFLGYLVVLTATSLWLGWRAIRRKHAQDGFRDRRYLAVALLNLACAASVMAVGLNLGQPLLTGFSLVGLLTGTQMLWRRARPLQARNWWLQEHYGAMLACGAATHVAFLGIGINRLLQMAGSAAPPMLQLLAWFLPVLVAVVAGMLLDRRHARIAGRTKPVPALAG
jgi:hypothetical protein